MKSTSLPLVSLQANINLLVQRRLSLLLEDVLNQMETVACRLHNLLPVMLVDTSMPLLNVLAN
jgi:hypothetical protein